MPSIISLTSAIALGTAVAIGTVGGYFIGKCKGKNKKNAIKRPVVWKSYETQDPLVKYAAENSLRLLPVQEKLKCETLKHRLGSMMGAPEITQLLQNIIRAIKAKKVIEIGVFTGYSTLGFGLALPEDGRVVACDVSEEFMSIGKPYWKEAGVENKIDVRIQPAAQTLDDLIGNGEAETFDFVFIDADKDGYDTYYEKSLKLIRRGGIIAIDNVLWSGSVVDENSTRPGASHLRALNTKLKNDDRIEISMLAIGDGLTIIVKK